MSLFHGIPSLLQNIMFPLLYFYFWIITYFQHLNILVFLHKLLLLCNKSFQNLVAQNSSNHLLSLMCSVGLVCWMGWAGRSSCGNSQVAAVRCWLGLQSCEGFDWSQGAHFQGGSLTSTDCRPGALISYIGAYLQGCLDIHMRWQLAFSKERIPRG